MLAMLEEISKFFANHRELDKIENFLYEAGEIFIFVKISIINCINYIL